MPEDNFYGYGDYTQNLVDAFVMAAANSDLKAMRKMLADGVDIDGTRSDFAPDTALCAAARLGLTRSTVFLLDNGADLNKPGHRGLTPLMNACACGGVKGSRVAIELIHRGAEVNYVRESDEKTALKIAVGSCTAEAIQALIDAGAEIEGPANTEQTALMLAARANHVPALKVLIENGANMNAQCKLPWAENRTALGLAELEHRAKAVQFLKQFDE